jgi:hypothetical protein
MAKKKESKKVSPKVLEKIKAMLTPSGNPKDIIDTEPQYKLRLDDPNSNTVVTEAYATDSSIRSNLTGKQNISRAASKNQAALQRGSALARIANPTSKENDEQAEGQAMGAVMMDVAKEVGVKDPQSMTDSEYEYVMNVTMQKQDSIRQYKDKALRAILDKQNDRGGLTSSFDPLAALTGDVLSEKTEVEQDPDVKDKPGTQPKKYYKGLSKKEKEARAKQFKKGSESKDDDAKAYKKAPGDKDAKTKPSKHTKKYEKMFGEEIEIVEVFNKGVRKKAKETGIPYSILNQVFKRGKAAWKTGHRPGTTPDQWGYARINSFATGGKTRTTADKDLWKKYQEYKKKKKKKTKSEEYLEEAKYQGKTVKLGDPIRNPSGSKKKFRVYVTHPKTGNVVKVEFGDPNMEIKRDDPKRRAAFRSRHGCDAVTYEDDRHTPKYWSCHQWRANAKVDN